LLLAACGGGYGGSPSPMPASESRFVVTPLVSDQQGIAQFDADLSNPWDLAVGGGSALWLANNGSARSALFNTGDLSLPALTIGVPQSAASARPTGVAFNAANGFEVTAEGRTGVARFIVASEGGTLSGWAPSLGLDRAVVAFDGTSAGAVYTGLAMTPQGVESVLLAADFRNGVIDTFSADFTKQPAGGRFVDPALPAGYAPFGVAAHGALIYVAYARPDASAHAPQRGAGLGTVNVFDGAGRLMRRLVSAGGALNAPWSLALAPADFGTFSGALLAANAGDGTITAFDAASGRPLGALTQPDGAVLVIDGLHGIAFGSGAMGQPTRALFFTAGPQDGRHGLLGRIDLQ
jgi:uncharacterized protein (TIGR03118 family)